MPYGESVAEEGGRSRQNFRQALLVAFKNLFQNQLAIHTKTNQRTKVALGLAAPISQENSKGYDHRHQGEQA
jgi:hypothetical protein